MTPLTQFVDQLTGPAIIRHLADVLRETSDDFPESEVRYHKAVDELRAALPEGYTPTLDAYLNLNPEEQWNDDYCFVDLSL